MKIAQHPPLLANLVRRHAQRLAHAVQQAQQIFSRPLGMARETAQVAKQHRDFRLARRQHHFGIDPLQGLEHNRGEKLAQAGPLPLEHSHVPQGAQGCGG